jgi:uncharacterized protein involved in response to NO
MNAPSETTHIPPAWLALGFRPFFLGAGVFAVVVMALWYGMFLRGVQLPAAGLKPIDWHAHEMLFGYVMAVVAGFLLTAVRNWTGIQTLRGLPLALLFCCWLAARLLFAFGGDALLVWAAGFDILFDLSLCAAITVPVVRAKLWANLAIAGKVALLAGGNLLFLSGALGALSQGVHLGLYTGLYVLLALIFTLSRRVLPFFIERGVGYPVELRNSRVLDLTSLVLLVVLWLADLFRPDGFIVAASSALLAVVHAARLWGWHTPGVWRKPLLWVLYLAYAALIAGFVLKVAVFVALVPSSLALHAFAVGGMGLMTLGMMTRVALGHTGRDIGNPPAVLGWLFALLIAAALVRVALPLVDVRDYRLWVAVSQWLWIGAFAGFVWVYFPVLTRPRIDGREG